MPQTAQPVTDTVSDKLDLDASKIETELASVDMDGEASKVSAEWSAITSGFMHFLIASSSVATDADGKFKVTLKKKGNYVFISSGQRVALDKPEKYFWYAKADFSTSKGSETIELNNDCELRGKDVALYGEGNYPLTNDDYMKRVLKLDASLGSN